MTKCQSQAILPPTYSPVVATVTDPLNQIVDYEYVDTGRSVADVLSTHDLTSAPTLVLYNSAPLLEADWESTVIANGDVITLARQPGVWLGISIGAWVVIAITAITAGYAIYTILTLDMPDPGNRGNSPNYSVGYRGNQRRPGQPVAVVFGNIRTYPDLGGQFSIYKDNNQWLYTIFDVTMGLVSQIAAADIQFEDTLLTAFSEYEFEQIAPGDVSTIYPSTVHVSSEVDSLELITGLEWTPAFVANPVGTEITEIIFDIVAPNGTFKVSSGSGNYHVLTSEFTMAYRLVGGGAWTTQNGVAPFSRGVATRESFSFRVPAGRYEARVQRSVDKRTQTDVSNALVWEKLRGVEPDQTTTETTRLAIAIRASERIGNQALTKMSVRVQRELPIYTGTWSAPQPTSSGAWAFAEICRAQYGGRMGDEHVDLDTLMSLDAEGHEFHGIYDNEVDLWSALNEVARPMQGRAIEKPGRIYTIVQDLPDQVPVAMYTMRNIVKGTFGIEHNLPVDEAVNFVRVTFKNEVEGYRETTIDCIPFGVTIDQPYEVNLRGVTNSALAYDIGLRMANESLYRRKRATFETALEGFIPAYGDTIRVGHYMIGQEQTLAAVSGEVRSASGNTLTVFEDLGGLVGQGGLQAYMIDTDGSPWGPVSCSVPNDTTLQLNASPPGGVLQFSDSADGPKYCVGSGADFMFDAKVSRVVNTSVPHRVRIECVEDDPNVYIGDAPPNYSPIDPPADAAPIVSNLFAELYGSDDEWFVRMTWDSVNCDYHIVDLSEDNRVTWAVQGRPTERYISFAVPLMDGLIARVRGVNVFIGPAVEAIINVLSRTITYPGVFNLRPAYPFSGNTCAVEWDALPAGLKARVKFIANGSILKQINVNSAITGAQITRREVMSKQLRNVQGVAYPAVGTREITVEMVGITKVSDGVWQEDPTVQSLIMKNDPMGAVQDIVYKENLGTVSFSWVWPELPPGGAYIHLGTVPGFAPTLGNLIEFADTNNATVTVEILPDTDYYFQIAGFDTWGPDDLVYTEIGITSGPPPEYDLPPIESYMLAPELADRIDLIDLNPPGGLRGEVTGINAEMADPATGTTAMAMTVTQNLAAVNDPVTGTIATATQLDGVQAELNDPATGTTTMAVAVTQHDVDLYDPADGLPATATLTQQVNTQVNASGTGLPDTYAATQTQATSIGGLEAKYTVKVDVNGHVAGYGLAAYPNDEGQITSEWLAMVDKFGIAHPGGDTLVFEVNNSVVQMSGARITDASIYNAKIDGAIYSGSWDGTGRVGWLIDKNGGCTFNQIQIIDYEGNVILDSGASSIAIGPAIDNSQQAWAEVSDIPQYISKSAFSQCTIGAYGNVWFSQDQPSPGYFTVHGATLYTPDATKYDPTTGWNFDGDVVNAYQVSPNPGVVAGFIFFVNNISSRFPGWVNNGSQGIFAARWDDANEQFIAVDGAANEYPFTPFNDEPLLASWSRPNAGSTGFVTFNSLVGVNTFLPQDGSTISGQDSIIIDSDFNLLAADGGNFSINNYWETAGADVQFNNSASHGASVVITGDGLVRQTASCEVVPEEVLYFSMKSYMQNAANGAIDFSVQFFDEGGNGVGAGEYQTAIWLEPSTTPRATWFLSSGAVIVPDNAVFMQAWARSRSTGSIWAVIAHLVITRAPTVITATTAGTYIEDLTVGTLKIQDNAVTVPLYDTCGQVISDWENYTEAMSVTTTPSKGGVPIQISWFMENATWTDGSHFMRLRRNGVLLYPSSGGIVTYSHTGSNTDIIYGGFSGIFVDTTHSGATSIYSLEIAGNASSPSRFNILRGVLTVTEVKK